MTFNYMHGISFRGAFSIQQLGKIYAVHNLITTQKVKDLEADFCKHF